MGVLDCLGGKMTPTESREVFTINNGSTASLDVAPSTDVESQSPLTHSSKSCKCNTFWRICLDYCALFVFVLAILGLFATKIVPNHKAGFFCNDPSLSLPFTGDTVSNTFLICSVIFMPLVVILVTEFLTETKTIKERLKLSIIQSLWVFRCYFHGLILNFVVMESMKVITGNPRPTFFDLCAPDTAKTCNGSEFVATFTCTSNYSKYLQDDSFKSFPSGHTSFSVYAGLFVAWYLQRRAWNSKLFLLIQLLQLICVVYAVVCSITRITDHRHHWWDVLVGFVLGVCTVLYSSIVLLHNLPTKSSDTGSTELNYYKRSQKSDSS